MNFVLIFKAKCSYWCELISKGAAADCIIYRLTGESLVI